MTPSSQTICLNMIVKDEAPVIRRCLDSVRAIIDSWVIVDTGSTDGTQELIREYLKDLPGELYERPWVDFAHNRSEALELARGRGDYIFVIDADEVVELEPGFVLPTLTADAYNLQVRYGGCSYVRKQLVSNRLPWSYKGVLHEYITTEEPHREEPLAGLATLPSHDGARARDPLTYRRDALVLEKALLTEPDNTRYIFYLAQSYRDAGELELAIRHYKRRVDHGGWREEVWVSLYYIAQLMERLEKPWPEVMEAYLAAWQYVPDRAGPLFRIAMHYQAKGSYYLSNLFLSRASAIPVPADNRLFIERSLYDFQLPVEHGVAAFYVGDHDTAISVNNRLLREGKLPPHAVEQVIRNRRFSVDVLQGPKAEAPLPAAPAALIVVPFTDPGPELDDCIDSLLQQEPADWQAIFIDNGSAADQKPRLPLDDPRVTFVRHDVPRPIGSCLAEALGEAAPDSVVLLLSPSDQLAEPGTLAQIAAAFADPGCLLAYGQYRTAAGQLGQAEPASSSADFDARGAALAGRSPIAFRARIASSPWEMAGLGGTRFFDAVWTIAADSVGARAAPSRQTTVSAQLPAGASSGKISISAPLPPASPMISCLMVTLDRLSLAKRAIDSYADQTWPNKELVIVTDGTPRFRESLERHVDANAIAGVRFVYPGQSGMTLGALRNLSLAEAHGEIVCQWDDDDCSHPARLVEQAGDMLRRNARASFMTDHLQLLAEERMLCWIDWTLGGTQGINQLAPGTLMMFRDDRFRYPESGPMSRQGEDSVLLSQIHATVPVAHASGLGYLYLYQYHGRNTFSREHHYHMANFRTSTAQIKENATKLREAVAYYAIAKPVVVVAQEGPVFALG
jgi:glycosyltransferase involved in cell wall biosynthesis